MSTNACGGCVIISAKENNFPVKMEVKQSIITGGKLLLGIGSFIATFLSMIELMYFLSDPNYNRRIAVAEDVWLAVSWSLLVNMSLLILFIIQHSVLAFPTLKDTIKSYGLQNIYRSLYVIISAIALQILMRYWYDIPEVTLWKFNINFRPFWWLYTTVHVLAWILMYVGNICMDLNELIGVKQIYYSIVNLPDPNRRKSHQLQRLNSHMRHPSFLAFLLIFWSVPVMSLDRFLLATVLTLYMYTGWNPDEIDYGYQHSQYTRKFHELERLEN